MHDSTRRHLNAINRRFYAITADNFSATRGRAWQGWLDLLAHLPETWDSPPYRVLDVGCGNGRFGVFLDEQLPYNVAYHGMDNNPRLLEFARESLPTATLDTRDIVESPPDSGAYDLVVLFGVIHHIPGADYRQNFMRQLAARVAAGGLLVFASWRFYEVERFRERVVAWDDPLAEQVETHDYLLDWRRGETALRYCHYVDDAEQDTLVRATALDEIARYRADGYQNRLNCYSVLRKSN